MVAFKCPPGLTFNLDLKLTFDMFLAKISTVNSYVATCSHICTLIINVNFGQLQMCMADHALLLWHPESEHGIRLEKHCIFGVKMWCKWCSSELNFNVLACGRLHGTRGIVPRLYMFFLQVLIIEGKKGHNLLPLYWIWLKLFTSGHPKVFRGPNSLTPPLTVNGWIFIYMVNFALPGH